VEEGGGESGGDAKRAEACWKRGFEVDEVGSVESQVRADGRSIVRVVKCYREVRCGCDEVDSSSNAMRRCDGEAQLISSLRNNTLPSKKLMDVLLFLRRMDGGGAYPSATPLRPCMRAFGRRGCRSCCASMEEEERPSKRWACGPVNRSSANARSPPARSLAS
jgi:hypothetical protein